MDTDRKIRNAGTCNVEPLLRRGAGTEIDTRAPLDEVVAAVLRVVLPQP